MANAKISPKILDRLNYHIELEMSASNLYRAAYAWCDFVGYTGTASFLKKQASEELGHMQKVIEYALDRDQHPTICGCGMPPKTFKSLVDVFKAALEHEVRVTEAYNETYSICEEDKDNVTAQFVTWFLSEQVEEEAVFITLLDRIELYGTDPMILMHIDAELKV